MWLSVEGCPKVAGDEQRMNDIRTNSMKKLQSLVVKGFKGEGEMCLGSLNKEEKEGGKNLFFVLNRTA